MLFYGSTTSLIWGLLATRCCDYAPLGQRLPLRGSKEFLFLVAAKALRRAGNIRKVIKTLGAVMLSGTQIFKVVDALSRLMPARAQVLVVIDRVLRIARAQRLPRAQILEII